LFFSFNLRPRCWEQTLPPPLFNLSPFLEGRLTLAESSEERICRGLIIVLLYPFNLTDGHIKNTAEPETNNLTLLYPAVHSKA